MLYGRNNTILFWVPFNALVMVFIGLILNKQGFKFVLPNSLLNLKEYYTTSHDIIFYECSHSKTNISMQEYEERVDK